MNLALGLVYILEDCRKGVKSATENSLQKVEAVYLREAHYPIITAVSESSALAPPTCLLDGGPHKPPNLGIVHIYSPSHYSEASTMAV